METLSRREEEALLKATKAHALKECDRFVKEFAECATGRTISIAWACREPHREIQKCMLQFTGPENMEILRAEYVKLRAERAGKVNQADIGDAPIADQAVGDNLVSFRAS